VTLTIALDAMGGDHAPQVVIAGAEKGKRGKIIEVVRAKQRAIVEGVKMIKRHTRKNQQNPQGAIVEREGLGIAGSALEDHASGRRASRRAEQPPSG